MCNIYRVVNVVLLYGALMVAAFGTGGDGGQGPREPVALLSDPDLCSLMAHCTKWCDDCTTQDVTELFKLLSLQRCSDFWNTLQTDYRAVHRCPMGTYYDVCIYKNYKKEGLPCQPSTNNSLVCFSQEHGEEVHIAEVAVGSEPSNKSLSMCPNCSCATSTPTTEQTTATPKTKSKNPIDEPIQPRSTVTATSSMTTGDTKGLGMTTIIGVAVAGVFLLILLAVICICCWFKCSKVSERDEEVYVYIKEDEIVHARSQGHMMTSHQSVCSNGQYPSCGHRQFNNEMYNHDTLGNSTAQTRSPPDLPANHPPPSNPPPNPLQYQQLNRGPPKPAVEGKNPGMLGGPCPHCRRLATDRSATAPLADRPTGLDMPPQTGTRNVYMALLKKNNTCPTPGTPPVESVCECHARPLSECSSASGSLTSEQQRNHTQAASRLSRGSESDQAAEGENPYYFKVEKLEEEREEEVPSPQSPHYFRLEDAETLPLEDANEKSPMLSDDQDRNGNIKVIPESTDSSGKPLEDKPETGMYMALRTPEGTDPPVVKSNESLLKNGTLSKSESVEGLPNGEFMDC